MTAGRHGLWYTPLGMPTFVPLFPCLSLCLAGCGGESNKSICEDNFFEYDMLLPFSFFLLELYVVQRRSNAIFLLL